MSKILVYGGVPLEGKVRIQGSKNAALPILAATLLTECEVFLENCPKISDVYGMQNILKSLGKRMYYESDRLCIETDCFHQGEMSVQSAHQMRSSLCILGALLGCGHEVTMEYPGGCVIGRRPIDIHMNALQKMGVSFTEQGNLLRAGAKKLRGCEITFPFPSVGATENVILAAVRAEGTTIVHGAAKEPEVCALISFLNKCGAQIIGAGQDELRITGVEKLKGASFTIPADRIVAGTYLFAVLCAGGSVYLEKAPVDQMEAVIETAILMGAQCQSDDSGIYVSAGSPLESIGHIKTGVYPGFPTDLQSMLLVAACMAKGEACIEEKIFEDRFKIVPELVKMGADLRVLDSHRVLIGPDYGLTGQPVMAKELRGGAALVLAGLAAVGETSVCESAYIERGYENICRDLRELGARVISV